MENKHITRLDLPDSKAHRFFYWVNLFILFLCWSFVIVAIAEYMITSNAKKAIGLLLFVPFRYFFFDLAPDRLQRRPAALSREVPITIFINYLRRRFPIPNGGFVATLCGVILAFLRIIINGYGLLYFDTFFFFFSVKNTKTGVPLEYEESVNQKIKSLYKDEIDTDKIKKYVDTLHFQEINDELTRWDFPIRRYRRLPNYLFETKEIAADQKANQKSKKQQDK